MALLTSLGPEVAALHGLVDVVEGFSEGRTLIEGHDDVSTQLLLNLDDTLRCEEMLAAIDMRTEQDAFIAYLAQVTQAEDLKPTAIGDQYPVPGHETVQSTQLLDDL